jgi:hypothetical protein
MELLFPSSGLLEELVADKKNRLQTDWAYCAFLLHIFYFFCFCLSTHFILFCPLSIGLSHPIPAEEQIEGLCVSL